MFAIAVKCIGRFWRALAMLSRSCFDTLSAVVLSYASTARSRAIVEAWRSTRGYLNQACKAGPVLG